MSRLSPGIRIMLVLPPAARIVSLPARAMVTLAPVDVLLNRNAPPSGIVAADGNVIVDATPPQKLMTDPDCEAVSVWLVV